MSPTPSDAPPTGTPGLLGRTAALLLRPFRRRGRPRGRLVRDLDDVRRERDRWQGHADSYERELSGVRLERAHLLAWLAALHPASAVLTPGPATGPEGGHRLSIEAGGRQLTWRLHPADLALFPHIPYGRSTALLVDGPQAPDQAAHLRRHTRLLAMEQLLFTAPAERWAPTRPPRRDDP
ncbi:hypothetical protein [Streptomyces sp. NPDC000983]|uniref:hypothetical protein n=1 Tax=Streptomyces sp. NPDC000983 TaxID=3154373 RepID=UPI00331B1B73